MGMGMCLACRWPIEGHRQLRRRRSAASGRPVGCVEGAARGLRRGPPRAVGGVWHPTCAAGRAGRWRRCLWRRKSVPDLDPPPNPPSGIEARTHAAGEIFSICRPCPRHESGARPLRSRGSPDPSGRAARSAGRFWRRVSAWLAAEPRRRSCRWPSMGHRHAITPSKFSFRFFARRQAPPSLSLARTSACAKRQPQRPDTAHENHPIHARQRVPAPQANNGSLRQRFGAPTALHVAGLWVTASV
jgi:hypothetical protein